MKKTFFIFSALLILSVFDVSSQEDVAEPENSSEIPVPSLPGNNDTYQYVIIAFEFDIKGRTRPDAILHTLKNKNMDFQTGKEIQGASNLDKYTYGIKQVLTNQRMLKDNAEVSYSIGEQMENGKFPVTIFIKTEDSWNIIALPRPKYTNRTGLDITIKARDYNFLGTMNPLRVDFGYKYDQYKRNSFQLGVYSDIPFKALGYYWDISFDNTFSYRPDIPNDFERFYYQNVTGLSMELPFHRTTFTFGLAEYFTLNEENSDRNKRSLGLGGKEDDFQNGLYMSTVLSTSWKIPTGIIVPRMGELTYRPSISARFNHAPWEEWQLQPIREGPFMSFGHSLFMEKEDWKVNYREGFAVAISNPYSYDFHRKKENERKKDPKEYINPLSFSISLRGIGHFIISDFFGISTRLMSRYWFYHDPEYNESAGDALRGIFDTEIKADYMLSLNMDFPFRVLLFHPSKWFNKRKLSFFDFELHVSPVFDMALYHTPKTEKTPEEITFNPKNIAATGGLEFIVFPAFMRNFIIRTGYAIDLRKFIATRDIFPDKHFEFYFIMGHFY